jgi:hypothetical protein
VKARRFVAITAFVVPLAVVAVACSFPDVGFGSGANGEAGTSETGTATDGTTADVATDASTDVAVDVTRREDGGGPIQDSSICTTRPKCDCDNDEYADINCDVDASALLSAKGNPLKPGDCDDLDDYRHPGQTYVDDVPPHGKDGNWNCTGGVEFFPPQNIQCGGNGLLGCTGGPGFLTAPSCGTVADYYTCTAAGLGPCSATPAGYQSTQACR